MIKRLLMAVSLAMPLLCSALTSPNGKEYSVEDGGLYYANNATGGYSLVDADYSENLKIPYEVLGIFVTEVANEAFSDRIDIETVEFPQSLKKIGDSAFKNCVSLKSVTFSDADRLEIGSSCFSESGLAGELVLPDNVVLGWRSFYSTKIESLKFKGSFSFANSSTQAVFIKCNNLKRADLGTSGNLCEYMFQYCESLEYVKLPDECRSIGKYAFSYCRSLATVDNITPSLQTISESAFEFCEPLEEFKFLEGLKTMGNYVFLGTRLKEFTYPSTLDVGRYNASPRSLKTIVGTVKWLERVNVPSLEFLMENPLRISESEVGGADVYVDGVILEELTLPATTKNVNNGAFSNIRSLKRLIIPNMTVAATYGEYAFSDCDNLESVTVGAGMSTFSRGVFAGCDKLVEFTMSAKNKCETLPRDMFNGCVSLSSVSIDGVKNLGQSAFENCGLREVSWQGVESVGYGCFFGCRLLEKVSLPAATAVARDVFYNCERLVEVSMPEALTVEETAFGGCASLSVLDLPKVQIFNSDLRDCILLEDLFLPEVRKFSNSSYFGMPPNLKTADFPVLETLPYYNAFKGLEYLEHVNIPLIREIPDYAFYGCKRLTGLNMINFTSVGAYAFYQCESLKEAYLPVVEVFDGDRQFDGCTGIETVLLGENLKEIPYEAFNQNTSLKKVDVMGNISKLDAAFEHSFCGEGSQIVFHGNVESIINRPFEYAKVENVIFHGDVAAIPGGTFQCNEFLTRMSFLGKVGGFGADAFKECPNIAEVRISDLENWLSVTCKNNGNPGSTSVSKVDFYLVDGLYEELLKSLVVNNVEKIRSHAFRNSSITSLKVKGEGPVTIQNEAFRNSALENIDLADCVVSIGDGAFAATNVEYVVIPESVTTVGQTAFQMNTNLKEIAISPSIVEIPNGFLWAGESLEYLVVPEGVEKINQGLLSLYGQLKFVSLPSTLNSLSGSMMSSLYQMARNVVIYSWANVAPAARLEDFAGVEVHVTSQALQSYRNDANWSKANLIADLDDSNVTNVSDSTLEIIVPSNNVDPDAAVVHCVVDCYERNGGDLIPVGTYEFNSGAAVSQYVSEEQDDADIMLQRDGMRMVIEGLQPDTEYEYDLRGYTRNSSLVYRSNGQFSTVKTSVDSIDSDSDGEPVRYYDINGIFVGCDYELLLPGIYVEVKGESTRKMVK